MVDTRERSPLRSVAVPAEHGGWGLTLEPVLLGLLVVPSVAGVLLGVGAMLAFLVRTPLKLALVDLGRDRWLPRTRLAIAVAVGELAAIAVIAVAATALAGPRWWTAVAIALPLVAVELWFDARSRGRRLVPELCGAVAVSAAVVAIVLAGGGHGPIAAGLWMILAARSIGSIPFVRTQIARLRQREVDVRAAKLAQGAAGALAGLAFAVTPAVWLGFAGVVAGALLQARWLDRPPVPAKVLGVRQMLLGLALVVVTAAGAALA